MIDFSINMLKGSLNEEKREDKINGLIFLHNIYLRDISPKD